MALFLISHKLNFKISLVSTMKEDAVFCLTTTILLLASPGECYEKCKIQDGAESFSTCLEKAANIFFANLDEDAGGIHESWQSQNMMLGNPLMTANFTYNVTKFINSTKSIKVSIKYDPITKTASGTIKAPHVGFVCDLDINGHAFNFRLLGIGRLIYHVYDMDSSFKTKLILVPGSENKFELIFNIKKIRNAKLDVVDLKAENKNIDESMRHVAKTFPNQLYILSKDIWDNIIKEHYQDLTRMFLKQMIIEGVITI